RDATSLDDRAPVRSWGWLVPSRRLPVRWPVLRVHAPWEPRQGEGVGTRLDRVLPHVGSADGPWLAERGRVGPPLVERWAPRGGHSVRRRSAAPTGQPTRGRWAPPWIPCRHRVPRPGRQGYGAVPLWQEHPLAAPISATGEPEQKERW